MQRCDIAVALKTLGLRIDEEFLTRASDGSLTVKPTGEQGSGILKSMSDANCFIILDDATGNVEAGTAVEVQLLEGIV